MFITDYFGQPACLAQSPQLYKQMTAACGGFERVMEVGWFGRVWFGLFLFLFFSFFVFSAATYLPVLTVRHLRRNRIQHNKGCGHALYLQLDPAQPSQRRQSDLDPADAESDRLRTFLFLLFSIGYIWNNQTVYPLSL